MTNLVVSKGQGVVISGDDALEIVAAVALGNAEALVAKVRQVIAAGLVERDADIPLEGWDAAVLDGAAEVLQQLRQHLDDTLDAATAMVYQEVADNHRLLTDRYQTIEDFARDKAESAAPQSSTAYTWAHLANTVVPFCRATNAVPAEDLDYQRLKDEGHFARFRAAVPHMRQVVVDTKAPLTEKVERIQEIMEAVKDCNNSPRDISRRFSADSPRVATNRVKANGSGWFWVTRTMSAQEDAVGQQMCSVFLDFSAPLVDVEVESPGDYRPAVATFLEG